MSVDLWRSIGWSWRCTELAICHTIRLPSLTGVYCEDEQSVEEKTYLIKPHWEMKCYFLPVSIYSRSSGRGGLSKLLVTWLSPWLPTSFYSLPPISAPHSFCCHVASHSSFQVHICFCSSPPTAFSDPSHLELYSSHPIHPGGGFRAVARYMAPLWDGTFWSKSLHQNQLQAERRTERRAPLHNASLPCSPTPAPPDFPSWSSLQSPTSRAALRGKKKGGRKRTKKQPFHSF